MHITPSFPNKASGPSEKSPSHFSEQDNPLALSSQNSQDQSSVRPRITFVYFDAGGGHRAAIQALCSVIEEQKWPWEISRLNLQELLDTADIVRKITGLRVQDFYNAMIKKGWTLGTAQLLKGLHLFIRLCNKPVMHLL